MSKIEFDDERPLAECSDCHKKTEVRVSQFVPWNLVCRPCEVKRAKGMASRAMDANGWNVTMDEP